MHATLRQMLKEVADQHERNAAHMLDLALAGAEDAHEALVDLIAERNVRGEALGPALSTYARILADRGPPRFRRPHARPRQNLLANFVIVCMLLDLMRQFPGLRLQRAPAGRRGKARRSSACSIVARTLTEAGHDRGEEEAIRKIWEHYGPPAIPAYRAPPKNGVIRFISDEID